MHTVQLVHLLAAVSMFQCFQGMAPTEFSESFNVFLFLSFEQTSAKACA